MDISLVIPTHERLLGVLNLLRSVTSQQLHNLEVEIIVVSNLHDPKLESAIQKLNLILPVHYTFTGIVGVNSARNEGIKRSVSDLVLFLDDDLFLKDPLYLQKLYTYATKYPEAGAIGGRYDLPSNHNLVDKAYHNISDSWMSQGKKLMAKRLI